jgi:uncharacterized protein (TIGR00297 family)
MINIEYVILLIAIGGIIYARRALDLAGSVFMVIMGIIIIFTAGFNWLLLIFVFLILGLLLTRTIKNVVSNGIVPFVLAAFGNPAGFIGSIAAATADTMASELGVLQNPRLITTFKKVPPGTDGGISILGTTAGIIGAGIIGFFAYILGVYPVLTEALAIAVIAGTFGCFFDSILGAVLEKRNYLTNEHVNLLATVAGALLGNLIGLVI